VCLVEPSAFTKISALGVEEQRVYVLLDLVSPADQWKSLGDGYRVETRTIVFEEDNAVKAPSGALFREDDQWAVFALDGDTARKRVVAVGRRNGVEATIAKGLEAGEFVIVCPSDAVKDGVKVKRRSGEG
jgi:HlyD family secretion protein